MRKVRIDYIREVDFKKGMEDKNLTSGEENVIGTLKAKEIALVRQTHHFEKENILLFVPGNYIG